MTARLLATTGVAGKALARRCVLQRCVRRTTTVSMQEESSSASLSGSSMARELECAMVAVRRAARLCSGVQRELKQSEAKAKADDSPVTVADFAAQAIVSWTLSQTFPDIALVAEEDATELRAGKFADVAARVVGLVNDTLGAEGLGPLPAHEVLDLVDRGRYPGSRTGRFWILDPIDGTKGFVRSQQYAICLGLVQDSRCVLGLLGCPNLPLAGAPSADGLVNGLPPLSVADGPSGGSLVVAAKGCGAHQMPLKGTGLQGAQRVRVDGARAPASARYMESMPHSVAAAFGRTARVAALLGTQEPPLRLDSQAKYALLARGDAEVYLRFPPAAYDEKAWDHAAGAVVVEEAGGVVSDALGRPLDFGAGRSLDIAGGIIASPPQIHEALLRATRETAA